MLGKKAKCISLKIYVNQNGKGSKKLLQGYAVAFQNKAYNGITCI
jgi:hypothetical protein